MARAGGVLDRIVRHGVGDHGSGLGTRTGAPADARGARRGRGDAHGGRGGRLNVAIAAYARRSATPAGHDVHARVLVIVENVPAAIDTRLRKQIDSLLANGHGVSIVTRRDPSNDRYRLDPRIRLYEYPSPPEPSGLLGYAVEYAASFAAASVLVVRALTQERVDVVQFCQPPDIYFPLAGYSGGSATASCSTSGICYRSCSSRATAGRTRASCGSCGSSSGSASARHTACSW